MDQVKVLLDLPFDVLLLLAAGYASYRIAFIGRDAHHSTIDVTFISLAFAAIAKLSMQLTAQAAPDVPVWSIGLGSAAASLLIAVVWRRWGQASTYKALRACSVSDHDGQPDVWRSMLARDLKAPTRLVVCLKDGRSLMCEELAKFNDAPMGPCLFGPDGSVALYVTDILKPGAEDWDQVEPFDPERSSWGYELSLIPSSEIARIDVSRPA
ncbi:hypothetical protein [Salipiger marinus]|uniref:hypothetical protein n=1 Tax=Salipiger marinus TaxID=555512 RepID=UPI004057E60E